MSMAVRFQFRENALWAFVAFLRVSVCFGQAVVAGHDHSGSYVEETVVVRVDGGKSIAEVDKDFICVSMDWWTPEKCDYGTCSWGNSSILNVDLTNPLLENAVKAFTPLKVRIGGSLEDRAEYNIGNPIEPCVPFRFNASAKIKFNVGCLPIWRWDELNHFFQRTGSEVIFGLNAFYGRTILKNQTLVGSWNSTNARDFIQYTVNHDYKIHAWEFGNELDSKDFGGFSPEQVAPGVIELTDIVKKIYAGRLHHPLIVAPDCRFKADWFKDLLQETGPGIINAVTHHIYNLGTGNDTDLEEKILNATFLDQLATEFEAVRDTLQKYGPWTKSWVGEAGGAANSGRHLVTDAFISGFWFLDQLGMAARFDTKTYCRQSLIGGNYGLLNTTTFHPNPDYYSALLWNRLMGQRVLAAQTIRAASLRAYAHCSKHSGGATLVLINLNNITQYNISVSVRGAGPIGETREEYHLSALDGDLHSQTVVLNGKVLEVASNFTIPDLIPVKVSSLQPISLKPHSIAFVFVEAMIPACLHVK